MVSGTISSTGTRERSGRTPMRSGLADLGKPELSIHGMSAEAAPDQLRGALRQDGVVRGPRY